MTHKFSEGQRVKVLEDAHLENGVERYRGCTGVVDHIVESTPELIFYSPAFSGSWDRGYIPEEAPEAVDGGARLGTIEVCDLSRRRIRPRRPARMTDHRTFDHRRPVSVSFLYIVM